MKNVKLIILLLAMGSVSGIFGSSINITNKYFKDINVSVYPKNTSSHNQYSISPNQSTNVNCEIGDSIIVYDDSMGYQSLISRRKFVTQLNGQYDIVLGRDQESLWMVQKGGLVDLFNVENSLNFVNKYSHDINITVYYGNNLSKGNPPNTDYIATQRYYSVNPGQVAFLKCEKGDTISVFSSILGIAEISSSRGIVEQLGRQYIVELSEDETFLEMSRLPLVERITLTRNVIELKNQLNTSQSNYNRFNEKVGSLRKKRHRSKKQNRALSRYRKERNSYNDAMNSIKVQIEEIKEVCPACLTAKLVSKKPVIANPVVTPGGLLVLPDFLLVDQNAELTIKLVDLQGQLNTSQANYQRYSDKVGSLRKKKLRGKKQRRALRNYRRTRDGYRNEVNLLTAQIAKIKADCPSCVVS